MNAIHQISLKLQMGIHPDADVEPEILRAMWRERLRQQACAPKGKAPDPEPGTMIRALTWMPDQARHDG